MKVNTEFVREALRTAYELLSSDFVDEAHDRLLEDYIDYLVGVGIEDKTPSEMMMDYAQMQITGEMTHD